MGNANESPESEVSRLPDGPKKQAMLKVLAQMTQLEKEKGAEIDQLRVWLLSSRRSELIIGLLLACVPGYFAVASIFTGRIPNIFERNVPYAYWDHDPYIFSFIVAFFGLLAFIILCGALGIVSFRRKINPFSVDRSTSELANRINQELASLEMENKKSNEEMPVVGKLFGVELHSQRISLWFAAVVIGIFVLVIARAIVQAT